MLPGPERRRPGHLSCPRGAQDLKPSTGFPQGRATPGDCPRLLGWLSSLRRRRHRGRPGGRVQLQPQGRGGMCPEVRASRTPARRRCPPREVAHEMYAAAACATSLHKAV